MCAKQMLIDQYTESQAKVSTAPAQKPDLDKYKAERTSLLHGEVQYDKYPEARSQIQAQNYFEDLDSIGKELSQDEDIKMFQSTDGLRRRPDREIKESLRQLDEIHNQLEETKPLRQANETLHSGLDSLNHTVQSWQAEMFDKLPEKKPGMQMVDLLEQKKVKQQRAVGDYSERAKDLPEDKPEAEGETKKKKRKNKNKKKAKKDKTAEEQDGAQTTKIELPESIEQAGKMAQAAKA